MVLGSSLPEGAFNIIFGRGSVVGLRFIEDPRNNAILFTSLVPTGRFD